MARRTLWDSYYGSGSLEAIQAFEGTHRIRFPKSYVEIVTKHNGAFAPGESVFAFHSNLVGRTVERGVGMFLPFGEVEGVSETMELKRLFPPDGLPGGLVMFSAMGNGDAICFDYRERPTTENPPVVVWHHEGTSGGADETSLVAESFDAFVDLLRDEGLGSAGPG